MARLGYAMTAYFGGRTEVRIRWTQTPVRSVDYASMYQTVFALFGLWRWVTADRLTAEDATDDSRGLLAALDREALHDLAAWPPLAGVFCRVRPQGELLPARAQYGGSEAWTIGLNRLEAGVDLWFTLADLLVAKLLGGAVPEILEAFRVVPVGVAPRLRSTRLRGVVPVDPATDDLFRLATEERARTKANTRLPGYERDRLAQFLKTFGNGGAYGVFAEVRQLDPVPGGTVVHVDGLWPIDARVATPEEPGAFCYPPLAATVPPVPGCSSRCSKRTSRRAAAHTSPATPTRSSSSRRRPVASSSASTARPACRTAAPRSGPSPGPRSARF